MAAVFEYIDESGQDTSGVFFVVSMLILGTERDEVLKLLEAIESKSKKGNLKWRKADYRHRQSYIHMIIGLPQMVDKIFFENFPGRKDYLALTAQAAGDALRHVRPIRVVVYVDGLRKTQIPKFQRYLKPSVRGIKTEVRGVRKEENNAFIRLVDAMCGLIRDAHYGHEWSQKTLRLLKAKRILKGL